MKVRVSEYAVAVVLGPNIGLFIGSFTDTHFLFFFLRVNCSVWKAAHFLEKTFRSFTSIRVFLQTAILGAGQLKEKYRVVHRKSPFVF